MNEWLLNCFRLCASPNLEACDYRADLRPISPFLLDGLDFCGSIWEVIELKRLKPIYMRAISVLKQLGRSEIFTVIDQVGS